MYAHDTERLWLQPVTVLSMNSSSFLKYRDVLNVIFTNTFLNEARIEICQGWMADGDSTALGSNVCPSILPLSCCQSWLGDTAREDFISCVSIRLQEKTLLSFPASLYQDRYHLQSGADYWKDKRNNKIVGRSAILRTRAIKT